MSSPAHADELAFVRAFVDDAVELVRGLRADGFRTETKPDRSLVTTADHEVNRRFIDAVASTFGDDRVLGEEESREAAGPRTWVIDPIDGTEQFVLGIPTSMIAVALCDAAGQPIVATAANPATRETYWAVRGHGAHRDGVRLRVSDRNGVTAPAIVRASGPPATEASVHSDGLVRMATADAPEVVPVWFPWPSAFSGCKVAEGSWDADLYGHIGAWDVAATALLVTEAGGRATDRYGRDQRYDGPVDGCVLSNGLVHDAIVERWTSA
ncbi:MAG: inositol monophosphatase [Actinomycetota bacterium]|nr:inositol monophosphatase [Actinomycetota bacterium]